MGERGGTVDDQALERAKAVLSRTFSLILLTEKLGDFGPLVQKTLGWTASDFDAFRAKKNPAPDTRLLEAWRPDWSEEIGRRMPLDRGFYAYAAELAEARMKGYMSPGNVVVHFSLLSPEKINACEIRLYPSPRGFQGRALSLARALRNPS